MAHQYINPDAVSKPANYSHVVVSQPGRVVFISGQVAIDKDGNVVGAGDLSKQAEQVFQNLQARPARPLRVASSRESRHCPFPQGPTSSGSGAGPRQAVRGSMNSSRLPTASWAWKRA